MADETMDRVAGLIRAAEDRATGQGEDALRREGEALEAQLTPPELRAANAFIAQRRLQHGEQLEHLEHQHADYEAKLGWLRELRRDGI